eukprot:TRINITY_DN463_c0_g1_i5.p1 TRINITY_DN463_c0_g1~~TRINITY_DN463_c0_g1_i5.p1  ORF type:complete len:292 (-),score=48.79 TRINITY_DN463_c0_g1_i5:97-972(-)
MVDETRNRYDLLRVVPKAIQSAFLDCDSDFLHSRVMMGGNRFVEAYSGACALVAMVMQRLLFVANAGDCRGVIARRLGDDWEAVSLTLDHTATNEEKILRKNHPSDPRVVEHGRVKGMLEPSRAIGDGPFKLNLFNDSLQLQYRYKNWNAPYITASPDVTAVILGTDIPFLIMASDGFWNHISNQEAVELVSKFRLESDENCATMLIKEVLSRVEFEGNFTERISNVMQIPRGMARNFHDDITITIVFFNPEKQYWDSLDYGVYPEIPDLETRVPKTKLYLEQEIKKLEEK